MKYDEAFITDRDPWWRTFSEALCNSRGYKTDGQRFIANINSMKQLKRALEAAAYRIAAVV